jgi:glycosyltransferase involved in cell wall biosynthesis
MRLLKDCVVPPSVIDTAGEKDPLLASPLAPKVVIIPNGMTDAEECDGPNHNNVFIYGSSPDRGLEYVLKTWPYIRTRIPQAELHIYYGFTEAAKKYLRVKLGPAQFEQYYATMMKMIDTLDGVKYFGAVDHRVLMEAYASAGFLLYPTYFPETGCITAMKVRNRNIGILSFIMQFVGYLSSS